MPLSGVRNRNNMKGLGQILAAKGNREDSILAHISPNEAAILKSLGGSGTTNPKTGLPQFFDAGGYLRNNPDVAADPYFRDNPFAHYERFGRNENRSWDDQSTESTLHPYLAANPDIASDPFYRDNPRAHYDRLGRGEGRQWLGAEDASADNEPTNPYNLGDVEGPMAPSTGAVPSGTDPLAREPDGPLGAALGAAPGTGMGEEMVGTYPKGYLDYLGDIERQNEGLDPWAERRTPMNVGEWLSSRGDVETGLKPKPYSSGEGDHRQKTDNDFRPPAGWDPALYLKNNPDLNDDPWAAANPLAHFALFGSDEGRGRIPGGYANANFGQARKIYLEQNPDVLDAALAAQAAEKKYLEENPDLAQDAYYKDNPWEHYNTIGKSEGRKWTEGAGGPIDPWEHFETLGKNEGRKWVGAEPKMDFSKVKIPGGDNSYRAGMTVRAINKGYLDLPKYTQEEASGEPGAYQPKTGDTPWGHFDPAVYGNRIPVDRYGWVEIKEGDTQSTVPPGSHYNIMTNKWLPPGQKPTINKKGQDMPERPGGNDFWDFTGGFMVGGNPVGYSTGGGGGSGPYKSGKTVGGITKTIGKAVLGGL